MSQDTTLIYVGKNGGGYKHVVDTMSAADVSGWLSGGVEEDAVKISEPCLLEKRM